ncbi:MAG: diaminopimelate decarboxylase [Polyangiaceae bacterium]|nr:diaminopimelate decarboxylase [Polyangiaceae bacterium]
MAVAHGGPVTPAKVAESVALVGTPLYLYDEATIIAKCSRILAMPNAFGLHVGYAMKANSSRAILELVAGAGLGVDASSLNEARRAHLAGIPLHRVMLTTQEVPSGEDRVDLERMVAGGLRYNACSFRQLEAIADLAGSRDLPIAVRVNPGAGSGESVTRNTGDKYSSFGIHPHDHARAAALARERGVHIGAVHVHIGSGGDPESWRANIDRMLAITERHFPDATTLNLGGGFKEARMPDERPADVDALGRYAKDRFEDFAARTGRRLTMVVEPGTYIVANAGYLVTTVIDRKSSGSDGFDFVVCDGGMESSTRPLLYGSRHPFYVVSRRGALRSSEFVAADPGEPQAPRVVVGRCCESGDSQTLDDHGHIVPRPMADPAVGDFLVVGGAGAYVSAMALVGYNSHPQAPEVLLRRDGRLQVIRQRQTLGQLIVNERSLEG